MMGSKRQVRGESAYLGVKLSVARVYVPSLAMPSCLDGPGTPIP